MHSSTARLQVLVVMTGNAAKGKAGIHSSVTHAMPQQPHFCCANLCAVLPTLPEGATARLYGPLSCCATAPL